MVKKKKKDSYDPTKFTHNFGQCIGCGGVMSTSQSWSRHKKACAHFQQKMKTNMNNSTHALNVSRSQTNANENLSKVKKKQTPSTKNIQALKSIQSPTPKSPIHRRAKQNQKLLQQNLKAGVSSTPKQKDLFLKVVSSAL